MYTEQELLTMCKEDPEKASEILLEKYEKLIWNVCGRRLENSEDIKECVNETFADFFLNYEKFDKEKSNLKNYLCMIADRKAIDTYRKNLRREKFLSEEADRVQEKMEFSKITSQEIERLEKALEQLPSVDRKILEMKYYDEMSYQEIGSKLGLNVESVKKRGQRSKKKLLYILLIGLLIATLVACAASIYKKYYFSDNYGYIWTDDLVYELVNKDAYIETEYVRYNVVNGIYQNGHLELELNFEWIGEDEVITKDNYKRIEKELKELLGEDVSLEYILEIFGEGVKKSGVYFERVEKSEHNLMVFYVHGDDRTNGEKLNYYEHRSDILGNSLWHCDCEMPEKIEEDSFSVWLGSGDSNTVELEFSALSTQEYEKSDEREELFNGDVLTLGVAVTGEQFAIVNLHSQKDEGKEFQLSPYVVNSKYGLGKKETKYPTLTSLEDTVYESNKIVRNDMMEETVYEVYFPSVPAGEYVMKLPYTCFMKEENSETITLKLPTEEENYVSCDETVLFADGSGFHILGIEKTEYTGEFINVDDYGKITSIDEVKEWVYTLVCETISGDEELDFCTAWVKATNAECMSGISQECPVLRVNQETNLESVEIYFVDPVYIWEQELEWKVTVRESE